MKAGPALFAALSWNVLPLLPWIPPARGGFDGVFPRRSLSPPRRGASPAASFRPGNRRSPAATPGIAGNYETSGESFKLRRLAMPGPG